MNNLTLHITKDFLEGYRQYKIDLVENNINENISYKNLEYIIKNGMSLDNLFYEMIGYDSYNINVVTGEIRGRDRFHRKLTTEEFRHLMSK